MPKAGPRNSMTDATAVAAFYTANAIPSTPHLAVGSGQPAIEKYFTDQFQRLSKDFEPLPETTETWIRIAMVQLND
jgi:hypothetical protein